MSNPNRRLPIISHEWLGADNCCGCLIVRMSGDFADIVCNECSTLIRTVHVADVERTFLELAPTDTICSARCRHCGALNTFPGFSAVEAFVCSECGEGTAISPGAVQ